MKNPDIKNPLKDSKQEERDKEIEHQEAPAGSQENVNSDSPQSPESPSETSKAESESSVTPPKTSEPESESPVTPPKASEPEYESSVTPSKTSEPESESSYKTSKSAELEPESPGKTHEPAEPEPESSGKTHEPPEPESDPTQGTPDSAEAKTRARKRDSVQLVDDLEEKARNESYDELDEDDTESEDEGINYSLLSKEDLVKLMQEKLDNPGKGNIKKDVEDIKRVFFEKISTIREEKKKHFLDEGGNIEDFKPVEEPVEVEMKELLHKYRGLKAEFTRQLEKTKQENLFKKQEILEGFRILMENQDSFEVTFRKFKELQKQWFAAGIVPHQNLKDLWDSYNYFVDKFNDYVRINRDLRALDLKKNLELKIQLCERTEALDKEANVIQAFKVLQKNHARWREIGPVPREDRDEIWDRFKRATSVINKKHQDYHTRLKESLQDNLEKKEKLCERIEDIAATIYTSHGAWADKTNQVLEIQKTWKTIGYAPKKDNNLIYARFRTACDVFFTNKAKFYAAAYEDQKENLKLKLEITERAEALTKSQEWKETTHELIQLQKRWKEIGPVPRRDSDKLWRRFRAACDTFFNNKSRYFEDIDSTFEDNLKAKEEIIAEMDVWKMKDNMKENLKALKDFQTRFNAIGYVPSAKKDWIKDQFRLALDRLLEKTDLDESDRSLIKFRYRIEGIINAPRADIKLNFERDKLLNKLQQLRNDMGVWENNIGFFKQSDSSEETIQGYQEKIDEAHRRIELLEQKIRILDDMENEN